MTRMLCGWMLAVLLVSGAVPAGAGDGSIMPVKMGLDSMSAADQAKLWTRLDDYAKADSILDFCGRKLNLYRRTWNAISPCIETAALRKVGAVFNAHRKNYIEILGKNYPDDEKKKAFCSGYESQLKTYVTIIEKDLSEARTMCDACMWC